MQAVSEKDEIGDKTMKLLRLLIDDERGATMAEYSMLLLLVTAGIVGTVTVLRTQIMSVFDLATESLGSIG
ncbi:MAG: Flp family type IVb pilin [Deltaproteobacteria bacterium]|nr:MAG: Flp family type IVb pilin [Deltaproteobacteria bacterium]